MITELFLLGLVSVITAHEIKKDLAMEHKAYVRHDKPHKYDQLPFCSEVVVKKNPCMYELYLQISKDSEHPQWKKIGTIFKDTVTNTDAPCSSRS